MPFEAGHQLGRYRILSLLGSGGMGDVYRAHDSRLARDVAIKLLKPVAGGRDATRALMAEARAASALSHANACHLHEVDEAEGHLFLVMELVEGDTLASLIPPGGLPADRAVRYAAQIAEALAHAHARGVVHRDLKTANVMVTPDGHVKVLDFGIAQRATRDGLAETTKSVAPFEGAGVVTGTLAYMSPEVIQGSGADARGDIWALGIVMFEMIAGRRPFEGQSPLALASAIVTAPVPELPPETPPGLRAIVHRCLRRMPGERFQAAGEVAAALDAISTGAPAAHSPTGVAPRWRFAAAALLVMAMAGGTWWLWNRPDAVPAIRSLAVLPFADLSPGAPSEYLAEGVTDAIITELGQLPLRVISRTSSMRFRNTTKSMQEIARELDVDAVLEGSLVRDGELVRVSARLIRAATESSLWSGSYDRELRDLLALQRDFARTVTHELRLTLTPDQQSRLARQQPVNPAAVEAYLQGRYQWFKRTPAAVAAGIALFERAIEADPSYAAPHAGLASSYVLLGLSEMSLLPGAEAQQRAKSAAARALALDPRTPEAHTALAYAELWSWNFEASERSFVRAIELNPSDATTRFWYAVRLAAEQRFDESIKHAIEGQRLDPVSPIITAGLSWVYHLAGRHTEAAESARRVLALEPDFLMGHRRLGIAYLHLSQFELAAQTLERALVLSGRHPDAFSQLGQTYALQGRAAEARKLLDELNELSKSRYVGSYNRALVYAGLKQRDEAFSWLERAYNERHGPLALLKVDPDVDLLRDDPRFDAMVRKVWSRPTR